MDNIYVREMRTNESSDVLKIGKCAFTGVESLWIGKPKQALVAVKNDTIVGAILYKFIMSGGKKVGYVDYAFIDPHYHNQGIGGILYKATVEYLWEQGCEALTAVVKDDNVGSWRLFLNNGFSGVSLPQLAQQFGFMGVLKQYFGTPFCFGIGMEYYVATKEKVTSTRKDGTAKQILSFVLANFLMILPALFTGRFGENAFWICLAFLMVLLLGVTFDYIGTKFSTHHNWKFRFNNGGGLVCALVNFASTLPMIGNWYPKEYEKSKKFHRDMGVTALTGWISLLALVCILAFSGTTHPLARSVWQIGVVLLIYRMIPFYPFESFGGRRVYEWGKWIYTIMAFVTLAVIICTYVFAV